jgi:hypothetical protein
MILPILLALSATAAGNSFEQDEQNLIPTINLSAVRQIRCDVPGNPAYYWTGSGSLIEKNTIVTAYHVADGDKCVDVATDAPLTMYKSDKVHDIALMTGDLPEMPYIRYSCQGYKDGVYNAYGISGYHADFSMFRQVRLTYVGREDFYYTIDAAGDKAGMDMATFTGATVHGMSGGPIMNAYGYMVGLVNAGMDDILGLPMGHSDSYDIQDTFLCKP